MGTLATNEIPAGGWVVNSRVNLQISCNTICLITHAPALIHQLSSTKISRLACYLLGFFLAELGAAAGIGLFLLLLLQEQQSIDLVGDRVLGADGVGDLLTADQAGHNAGTDNKGQHKPVHSVPVRGTATGGGPRIIVVEEGEGAELADQGVLDRQEQSRPRDGGCDHTGGVAAVSVLAAVSSPFKTPVDGSEEGEDLDQAELGVVLGREAC